MSPKGGPRRGSGRPRVFHESRNLIVRVEKEIHALLTKLAEEGDVTVSDMVRPLLERLAGGKRKRVAKGKRK
jgi:hypothetical protein